MTDTVTHTLHLCERLGTACRAARVLEAASVARPSRVHPAHRGEVAPAAAPPTRSTETPIHR